MTSDVPDTTGPAHGTPPVPEFVVPWSWGSGPPSRTVPVEVVLRAIRDDDYTEMRAWNDRPEAPARPTRRRELRAATLLVLLGGCCVLGGLLLLGLLLVVTW